MAMVSAWSLVLLSYVCLNFSGVRARGYSNNFTLEQKMREDPDLSQVSLVVNTKLRKRGLQHLRL